MILETTTLALMVPKIGPCGFKCINNAYFGAEGSSLCRSPPGAGGRAKAARMLRFLPRCLGDSKNLGAPKYSHPEVDRIWVL